jgi:signal transduction histidine kinase
MTSHDSAGSRILIFIPMGRDAELASRVLESAGLSCRICGDAAVLSTELEAGVGVILTTEDSLPHGRASPLDLYINAQPPWSDLPVIALTMTGGNSPWIQGAYQRFGNLTLLEKPARTTALISAVRSSLRARHRQYEIRGANERRDEFLAMLAHELRNPMAPISASAQMLSLIAHDPGKVVRCSEVINRQIKHMTTLIDDLLDVARVTRGMIELDRVAVDIRHALSDAVEQVNPLINQRGHHLSMHLPGEVALVLGDRKRLVQVIVNLLNNATKYTPDAGTLVVSISLTDQEVTLSVADNGIGMTPAIVDSAFDTFTQAERTSDRSQGGLGLGLALVRSLITAHGGSVKAASPGLGKGSTFTVHIPRLLTPATERASGLALIPDSPCIIRLSIVVVDDNKDAADTLAMLLTQMGHIVSTEHDPLSAVKRIASNPPDVCLLDIGMPGMDGYEMARLLKAEPCMSNTVLIAVTGYGQGRDKTTALDAGFAHHVVKPIEMALLATILAGVADYIRPIL